VDFIHARELPLWTPYLNGGQPYLADIPFFPLYPFNLLYVFLPFFRAFNLNIVLHFIGCSLAAYLFSRVIGFQPLSSLIIGVIYEFCGYTLSLANHGCRLLTMPCLPLLFLFWHLYLLEGKRKWLLATVIGGVMQLFVGASEMNVLSLLLLLGWSFVYPYAGTSMLRRLALWMLLGIVIIGIASVQILPTIEMASRSIRKGGITFAGVSQSSLYPERLPEIIFPEFLGHLSSLPFDWHYWGGKIVDIGTPNILNLYFGIVIITLAVVGSFHRGHTQVLSLKVRGFLCGVFILSLLCSLGRFFPLFHIVIQNIPLTSLFRYPIKSLAAGIFPIAILAGYASEVHFSNNREGLEHPPTIQSPSLRMLSECPDSAHIRKLTSHPYAASVTVSNQCDGYLVFSEPYYPGWRVYVDGKLTPILRANYAFSAIFLPTGEHEITRIYRPNSLLLGAFSSAVFCGLLGLILYKKVKLQ
jgi:hypothetical protein